MSTTLSSSSLLANVSDELAGAVERAGAAVVTVDGRRRHPASGIVWTADGLIVTANHVVERDEELGDRAYAAGAYVDALAEYQLGRKADEGNATLLAKLGAAATHAENGGRPLATYVALSGQGPPTRVGRCVVGAP